jgi:hypothetical protein
MRVGFVLLSLALVATLSAGTLGIFRGRLVQAPEGHARHNWIFVQSPNGMLRQVEISQAKISYADSVPLTHRSESPGSDLVPGVDVLVTADQDGAGEWRAHEIEILTVRTRRAGAPPRIFCQTAASF